VFSGSVKQRHIDFITLCGVEFFIRGKGAVHFERGAMLCRRFIRLYIVRLIVVAELCELKEVTQVVRHPAVNEFLRQTGHLHKADMPGGLTVHGFLPSIDAWKWDIENYGAACDLRIPPNESVSHHPTHVMPDDKDALQFER